MDIVEVRKVHKDLQKAFQDRNQMVIVDILNLLKKEVIVSESLLIDTKLGITVGKLRNYSEKYVADLAKEIVKKWKEDMSAMKSGKKVSLAENKTDTPITTSELSTPNTFEKTRDSTTDCIEKNITGDKVRDNCVHLIYNALVYGSEESSATILSKAKAIDEYVFNSCLCKTDGSYRQKMRSLFLNLKDKNNPTLRQNVVSGELSIPRFCTMTPQEMASKERREEDKKIEEMNLFNAQGAKPIKAITDLFQCGKCKQRKVSYYQVFTKNSDWDIRYIFYRCKLEVQMNQ
ncbi:transcription elongation factor S-II [Pneumocystis jirovecii RU7]|uniref:Transcription elongation factor S-II n=1 Tax=Pneumocystis jirovecii (strain RU7) TaxID=1408657 RepID=A0A0W4ZEW0_PNEJ7|nr:transcription elongation factor S-II [Pneumocystis jirovecii RU7]KTW26912.1 transcription elongation factor S-II [Pneumocystis jirovecii RU7]